MSLETKSTAAETPAEASLTTWDVFLACLSVYILGAMTVDHLADLPLEISNVLHVADHGICLLFLFDFFRRFFKAPSKAAFLKWGWIDLLASIPAWDAMRWGRVFSLGRLFLMFRAIRSFRVLWRVTRADLGRSMLAITALVTMLVLITGSMVVVTVETAEKSNIKTGFDALWWGMTTITTVGYGDHFPVTPAGRITGAVLMALGITLYATFTAFISAKIMNLSEKHRKQQEADPSEQLLEELRALRGEVAALRQEVAASKPAE
jgi:voltage-gated potassium channel